ncbi:calcium-binding protein [Alsobacter sp. SYSU BS001988]
MVVASQVNFQTLVYATSLPDVFVGAGGAAAVDAVSYENAPSLASIGSYDIGVVIDMANSNSNTGWASGDSYVGVEELIGSRFTDAIYGDATGNIIDGGGSPDFIFGREGDDLLLGGGGFDFVWGDAGDDIIDGQWQTDQLHGGDGDDQLWGGTNYIAHVYPGTNYADILFGDAGNDELHGDARPPAAGLRSEYDPSLDFMAGADELHGGPGNDRLNGDGGDDKLWGDAGADSFIFDPTYTVIDATGAPLRITPGNDVVFDFNASEGDTINLNGEIYTTSDNPEGYRIFMLEPVNGALQIAGTVTLANLHSFNDAWVTSGYHLV